MDDLDRQTVHMQAAMKPLAVGVGVIMVWVFVVLALVPDRWKPEVLVGGMLVTVLVVIPLGAIRGRQAVRAAEDGGKPETTSNDSRGFTRFVTLGCLVLVVLSVVSAVVNFAQGDVFHGAFSLAASFMWGVPVLALKARQ